MPARSLKPIRIVEKFAVEPDDKRTSKPMDPKVSPVRRVRDRQEEAIPTDRKLGALLPAAQDLAELLATLAYQQLQSSPKQ